MKTQFLGSFILALLMAAPAFAAGNTVAKCSNGEEVNVTVKQVAQGGFRADVTVQSTGDSYPTFHFKNLELVPQPAHDMGAPTVYRGKGFELSIQKDALNVPGTLDVPSIGVNNERLSCK